MMLQDLQPKNLTGAIKINLGDIVGKGYKSFWESKERYLVVKGSRGSKKSTTTSLRQITHMMKYPESNGLVVRRYEVLHRDSTFAQLQWAINRLKVSHLWEAKLSPLRLIYKSTGQQILFRGLDNAESLTSITLSSGVLDWCWIEEIYQVENEDDFNKLDLSLRGQMPDGYWRQIIMTFNPWSSHSWLKKRFFDIEDDPMVRSFTTNYMCNEFLDYADYKVFENMKERNPRRYQVEGLGDWGITDGLIFENWRVENFNYNALQSELAWNGTPIYPQRFGLDFGFSVDPTAFIAVLCDVPNKKLYVYDEIYSHRMSNLAIYQAIKHKNYHKVKIVADSEDPRTINELVELGLRGVVGARKGADSVRAQIRKLQDWEIIVHPRCEHFAIELGNHCWAKNREGLQLDKPAEDGFHHLIDAFRYATEDVGNETFSF